MSALGKSIILPRISKNRYQMKINGCHSCIDRRTCEEKKKPCKEYRKEPKKDEKETVKPTPATGGKQN